jgi:general secretion pathway protein J
MNERGFTFSRHSAEHGFTLVELLIALLIFGMLAAGGVGLLSFSVQSQAAAGERLGQLASLRRTGALLSADFAQAAERMTRDTFGVPHPAFSSGTGGETRLSLVRRGWENFSGAQRPSLQKVEYRLAGDRLERQSYSFLDGAEPLPPATVMEGVRRLDLRFRDVRGEWRKVWDPVRPDEMPRAIEVTLDTDHSGTVRQLFLVGTDA